MPPFSPSPMGSWPPHSHPNKRHALPPPQQHSNPAFQNELEATIGPRPIQIMVTRTTTRRSRIRITQPSFIGRNDSVRFPSGNQSCLAATRRSLRRSRYRSLRLLVCVGPLGQEVAARLEGDTGLSHLVESSIDVARFKVDTAATVED